MRSSDAGHELARGDLAGADEARELRRGRNVSVASVRHGAPTPYGRRARNRFTVLSCGYADDRGIDLPDDLDSRSPAARPGGTGSAAARRSTSSTRCASAGARGVETLVLARGPRALARRGRADAGAAAGARAGCSTRRASCARRSTPACAPPSPAEPPCRRRGRRRIDDWLVHAGDAPALPARRRRACRCSASAPPPTRRAARSARSRSTPRTMLGTPEQRERVADLRARTTCSARFYDRSPAGRRRWCSMALCGNVAKARRHRARRRRCARDASRSATARSDPRAVGVGVGARARSRALRQGLPALGPALRDEFGLSLGAGRRRVRRASAWASWSTLLPWGWLADRVGERPVLTVGLGGAAARARRRPRRPRASPGCSPALLVAGVLGGRARPRSGRAVMGWFGRHRARPRARHPPDGAPARRRARRADAAAARRGAAGCAPRCSPWRPRAPPAPLAAAVWMREPPPPPPNRPRVRRPAADARPARLAARRSARRCWSARRRRSSPSSCSSCTTSAASPSGDGRGRARGDPGRRRARPHRRRPPVGPSAGGGSPRCGSSRWPPRWPWPPPRR